MGLDPVFSLGVQPLANEFRAPGASREGFYPLGMVRCPQCTLCQLSVVVDNDTLYRNYSYVTSTSNTMRRHFSRLICDLESEKTAHSIVEIGSNDGVFLSFARECGWSVLGIDPALNLAAKANLAGVSTLPTYFGPESAEEAFDRSGAPGVILARHCFNHFDDWRLFIEGVSVLASYNTVIALEVPYLSDMLTRNEFDTIYHEHRSYITLTAIDWLLRPTPFVVHRTIRYGVHGGSLLVMIRHKDSGVPPHLSADEFIIDEQVSPKLVKSFQDISRTKISRMRDCVHGLVADKKRVCGFGASAKGTVWIHACQFTEKDLLFVSDNSPLKPGCLVPGTNIPVIKQDEFLSEHPDYAVCFVWNYKSEILETQKKWRDRGGKFIFPTVDDVEIV